MARSQYKNRLIFPSGKLNPVSRQWKPTVSIFWKTTTPKFYLIDDLPQTFDTEREAIAFAAQAGKAWVDSQPPVPPALTKSAKKLPYRGYLIEITVSPQSGLWTAEVNILPKLNTPVALNHMTELDGFNSEVKARSNAINWGKGCIDLYATNTLPTR